MKKAAVEVLYQDSLEILADNRMPLDNILYMEVVSEDTGEINIATVSSSELSSYGSSDGEGDSFLARRPNCETSHGATVAPDGCQGDEIQGTE